MEEQCYQKYFGGFSLFESVNDPLDQEATRSIAFRDHKAACLMNLFLFPFFAVGDD
jgi:hypothetical protein